MKYVLITFVVALIYQASAAPSYCGGCGAGPCNSPAILPAVAASNSVAYNLADTLNLLTVSSLLSQQLPYNVIRVPLAPSCGCGGYACNTANGPYCL